jgi:hypothetical protein
MIHCVRGPEHHVATITAATLVNGQLTKVQQRAASVNFLTFMLVMFIFMNTGSAIAASHVMMDVVHASVNANSAKTKTWRA